METNPSQYFSTGFNYSTISTKILSDNKLSASAKGIYAFMLSLPKNQTLNKKDLPMYFKEGYYALNKAFEELVNHRLVHKIEQRDTKGRFHGYIYKVFDFPKKRFGDMKQTVPSRKYRNSENQESGNSLINEIFCEDCLETLSKMPNNFIDMVLTSPPFDTMRQYKGNGKFEFEKIAVEITRVLKVGAILVWIVGDETKRGSESGNGYRQAIYFLDKCKLKLHDSMVYNRTTTTYPAKSSGTRYSQNFDMMYVFAKGKPSTVNLIKDKKNRWEGTTNFGQKTDRDKNDNLVLRKKFKPIPEFSPRTNVWLYNNTKGFSSNDDLAYGHPAIFPLQLAEDMLVTFSKEGDLIYDCFSGSGTVLLASKKLNRNFIGSEIVKEYCDIILERLKD